MKKSNNNNKKIMRTSGRTEVHTEAKEVKEMR